MKRRAFLAGLIGLPAAAKIATAAPSFRRINIRYTANDIEFLESRRFEVDEIARIFRVDPSAIAGVNSNGCLMELRGRQYVEHVLVPYKL